jgi:hypothetical protein
VSADFRSHSSRRGLREIVHFEAKARLPALLREWGYVREIEAAELALGLWFAYGDDGVFWLLTDAAWQKPGEAQLHVCAAPSARGRIASRWILTAIEVIACLLGVTALHAPVRDSGWEPLLLRFGWVPISRGPHVQWLEKRLPDPPKLCESGEDALGDGDGPTGTEVVANGNGDGPHPLGLAG